MSYNILKELGIDDTSGLFGALIGGMFSILAVKITIDSSSKQSFKKNLDFASPKIVITTLLENVDSVIGKTAFMREDYDNDRIIYFTDPETDGANEMFTFYVTNIGGEALNITLSIHFTWRNLLSDYIFWFAMENNDIKKLDEFPMLKKGNALEIKISKEHISEKLEFIVSYNDVFSNRYIQYHDVRVGSSMEVELLPKQIKRKRKKKYYWRTTKLSSFFNEDITEEAGRNR